MKDTTTLLVLMLATIATGIIASVAEGAPAPTAGSIDWENPRAEVHAARREALIGRYDADHDGRLDPAERATLRTAIQAGNVPPAVRRALKHRRELRRASRQSCEAKALAS